MSKVSRVVVADGEWHEVACAVRADGVTSPASELLELLESGAWKAPRDCDYSDERQSSAKRRFLAQAQHLADYGELEPDFNRLDDGVWELKEPALRLTFFDTPGDGTYTPKYGEKVSYWTRPEPPEFDEYIRLGHYFPKTTQKTLPKDINLSKLVREEDLAHDRD